MVKGRYLTESDRIFKGIDEKEYRRRAILDQVKENYIYGKYCIYEQQKVLEDYYNQLECQLQ